MFVPDLNFPETEFDAVNIKAVCRYDTGLWTHTHTHTHTHIYIYVCVPFKAFSGTEQGYWDSKPK